MRLCCDVALGDSLAFVLLYHNLPLSSSPPLSSSSPWSDLTHSPGRARGQAPGAHAGSHTARRRCRLSARRQPPKAGAIGAASVRCAGASLPGTTIFPRVAFETVVCNQSLLAVWTHDSAISTFQSCQNCPCQSLLVFSLNTSCLVFDAIAQPIFSLRFPPTPNPQGVVPWFTSSDPALFERFNHGKSAESVVVCLFTLKDLRHSVVIFVPEPSSQHDVCSSDICV